jgi:hypothetical protein
MIRRDALHFQKKLLNRRQQMSTHYLSNLRTINQPYWKMCNA